jgi:hypothetical protein
MMTEHTGLDGGPCQCTPDGMARVTRDLSPLCPCHHVSHSECPDAEPCIGGCGRKTTAHETNMPGYCPHCAADRRWRVIAA